MGLLGEILFKKEFQKEITYRIKREAKNESGESSYVEKITGGNFSEDRYAEFYVNLFYMNIYWKNYISCKEAKALVNCGVVKRGEMKENIDEDQDFINKTMRKYGLRY